ncbi:MAG: amidase [Solirubrobacterales bacterium]
MTDAQLLFKPAHELAATVRSGEVSARELTELSLARAGALEPRLGAFTVIDEQRALAAADAVKPGDPRPFAGVPTAIKDINVFLAGYPFTAGSNLFGDFVPDFDSSAVARLKDAGFVIIGKTKTPEMGIVPVTEPLRFGPARNPFDTDRTPGGSSGGSAAAVAAGIVPIAHGNDGGGSLRIPAACCGLVGFKASRNRVSSAPLLGESPLTAEGMLSRSVIDVAASLDLLAGYMPGDANWAPPPSAPFAEAVDRDPGRLKIGFTVKPPLDLPVDPLHERQVRDAAALLESLGHEVEETTIPWDNPEMMMLFTKLFAGWISTLTSFAGVVTGREPSEELVEPLTWEMWELAQSITALDWINTNTTAQAFTRVIVASTYGYDAVLTPVLNTRPVRIGEIDTNTGMAAFAKAAEFTSFTAIANLSGQPAVSLPMGLAGDGLPLSVQLIGRPAGEEALFSLCGQIERARPWTEIRPALT